MIYSHFHNEFQNRTEQKTKFVTEDNDEFYANDSNRFKVDTYAVWSRVFTR